jgi:catalase
LKDQYRHRKTILVLGAASAMLGKVGIANALPSRGADPGLIVAKTGADAKKSFMAALAKHRHVARDRDSPSI